MALQRIDSAVHATQHSLADEPARLAALDSRLADATSQVNDAKERIAQNTAARREIEKDVTLHQGRLSKFRDQAMNVKTNQEYHAIQHEIAFAQNEIKTHEDRMLERMMESDELAAALKSAEANLAAVRKEVDADRKAIAAEHDVLREKLATLEMERAHVIKDVGPEAMSLFDLVSKRRNGVAMAEAKDGICSVCHVRLRPQVFNTVRRNEALMQCDSCQRILYFVPPVAAPATDAAS
ncbi:MAG: C4-type zinc ribbon domain-containing protein [Vicinamibacterales bacterium]